MPSVSIVIPTYTRSDKLRECLASIIQYTDMSQTEILVVANGASEETRQICEVYREFPVTLLWYPEPLGYPKSVNRGIEAAKGDYIVLLNDDALLLPQPRNEWIDTMLKPMLEDEMVGLTGPLEEFDENSEERFLIFFCVMIQREVFESIGLLDETFKYFGEDSVTGDTPVIIRRNGLVEVVPIADLYPEDEPDGRISVNSTEIYTRSGWSPLNYCYKHRVKKPIYSIRTQSSRVNFTGDHSVFSNGQPVLVSSLATGDRVDVMTGDPLTLNENGLDDGWEQGFFTAEGSASINYYMRTSARGRHKVYPQVTASANVTQYGDIGIARIRRVRDKWGWAISTHKAAASSNHAVYHRARLVTPNIKARVEEIIATYYTRDKEKKVPIQILNSHNGIIRDFLQGYFEGDGHVARRKDRNPQRSFTTKSPSLAFGVQLLLRKLGYSTSLNVRSDKPHIFNVRVLNGKSAPNTKFRNTGIKAKVDDGTIRAIIDVTAQYADSDGYVDIYDVNTTDGSFIAGGLVAHNTDFCIRARNVGWKIVRVPEDHPTTLATIDPNTTTLEPWKHDKIHTGNFRIFHDAESTIGHLPDSEEVLRESRRILRERYGKKKEEQMPELNLTRAKVIDGWFAESELEWVAQQAKHCKVIVEIGSWHGRSSRGIADNLPEDGILYCVDTWQGSSGEPEMHGSAKLRQGDHAHSWWWCNLHDHITNGKVIPVRMNSPNAAQTLNHLGVKADMIFVDADHSYEGVKTDILAWRHLLKDGGLFCGHDYYTEGQEPFAWMGVRQCINEMFPDVQQALGTSIWWSRSKPIVKSAKYACLIVGESLDELEETFKQYDDYDRFVVIETRETFDGQPRPLNFSNNLGRFGQWMDRITHLQSFDFKGNKSDVEGCKRWVWDSVTVGLSDCRDEDQITLVGETPVTVSYEELKATSPSALLFPRRVVIDAFPFNDELDLLELRFNELNSVVDRWVITEAPITHSGEPKPLYFQENLDRFQPWLHKISHIIVDDFNLEGLEGSDKHWAIERHQRSAIMRALTECKDDDIILIGDTDEIPNAEAIRNYQPEMGLTCLEMKLYYGYMNLEGLEPWRWTRLLPYGMLKTMEPQAPCVARYNWGQAEPNYSQVIESGGWHFSFMGGPDEWVRKLEATPHQEYNKPEFKDKELMKSRALNGDDILGRDIKYQFVSVDESFPRFVRENKERFVANQFIYEGEMHPESWQFIKSVKEEYPDFFKGKKVLEVGSLDINGSVRQFFEACDYEGIDVAEGKGVDRVCLAHQFFRENTYDVVISSEMLEHDQYWWSSLKQMYKNLKPGGLLIITCAGPTRPEHGTARTNDAYSSPFTAESNYYRNISKEDLLRALEPNLFSECVVGYERGEEDLNFYGFKQVANFSEEAKPRNLQVESRQQYFAKHGSVTACVSTKDRYQTTLPLCLSAILNQTHTPDHLFVYDDSEHRIPAEQLEKMSPFEGLFKLATDKGIKWQVFSTPRQGQVANHQHCLDTAETEWIWRVDDDEIPTPNCLQVLLETVRDYAPSGDRWTNPNPGDQIGAVSGLVHHPGNVGKPPEFLDGSLNDVKAGFNLSWYDWNGGVRQTEHLYSTFLLRVKAAREVGGYPRTLSTIGHREETIITHLLHRAGWKVVITPHTKTYHLREGSGGIRSFQDHSLWEHDEQVFQSYLNEWGVNGGKPTKVCVLDCGVGDHWAFKSILPKLREKHADKELILSVCYPSVFEGEPEKLISIADAKNLLGERFDESSIYRGLWDRSWAGSLAEGMLEFFS